MEERSPSPMDEGAASLEYSSSEPSEPAAETADPGLRHTNVTGNPYQSVPVSPEPSAAAGSFGAVGATSPRAAQSALCLWCRCPLEAPRLRYCSKKCRQTGWRARRLAGGVPVPLAASVTKGCSLAGGLERRCRWCDAPLSGRAISWCSPSCKGKGQRAAEIAAVEGVWVRKRLAYFDPPYPGLAAKYYRNEPTFAGEVDHAALIAEACTFDGWALSTSAEALPKLLPLCPPEVRIGAWTKTGGVSTKTRGPHNRWEPVLYVPARLLRPGFPDCIHTGPARGGGTLMGRKPLKVVMWIFALLGAEPGDELEDRFPGTGIVSKAWGQFQLSPRYRQAASRRASRAASPGDGRVGAASPRQLRFELGGAP